MTTNVAVMIVRMRNVVVVSVGTALLTFVVFRCGSALTALSLRVAYAVADRFNARRRGQHDNDDDVS